MFVQMVQHKQRSFVAEFVNHVPNRTVQVLRIHLPLQFSHFSISLFTMKQKPTKPLCRL